jgi:hypothetical protein
MQHRVSPFALQDRTKTGHRKIIALFLPQQRKDWWFDVVRESGSLKVLPEELAQHVHREVEDWPMGLEEAKTLRKELMEERSTYIPAVEGAVYNQKFSFCEH